MNTTMTTERTVHSTGAFVMPADPRLGTDPRPWRVGAPEHGNVLTTRVAAMTGNISGFGCALKTTIGDFGYAVTVVPTTGFVSARRGDPPE